MKKTMNPAFKERRMPMKFVKDIYAFVEMHMDLGLPMPERTFQETIPMTHRISRSFPKLDEIFSSHYNDKTKCYILTFDDILDAYNNLHDVFVNMSNINYKAPFGAGGVFKDQLVRYSQTEEGKRYGLQATRNFRLGGAIHFETNAQAERFLNDWITVRKVLEEEE